MSKSSSESEESLIKRVQLLDDRDAFSSLVKSHQEKVRGFLRRASGDKTLAYDLSQECFLQAYRKIQSYRFDNNFLSWLLTIAYNIYLQQRRTEQRRYAIEQKKNLFKNDHIEISDTQHLIKLDIEFAMSQLKQIEAAAITLNFTFGFSHREISNILNFPVGTIKSHIRSGQQKLKQILSDDGS